MTQRDSLKTRNTNLVAPPLLSPQSKAISPDSLDIAFNMALLKKDYADGVMTKREKNLKRTLKEIQQAKAGLEEAKETFTSLKKAEKSKTTTFKPDRCEKFAADCDFLLSQIDDHIKYEEDKEVFDQQKRAEQKQKAEKADRERKIQELTKEAEVAAEAERREKLAENNAVKAKELADNLRYGMGATGSNKKKKRDGDAMEDDSDDDDDDDDGVVAGDEVEGGGGGGLGDVPSNADLFGGEDSSDDENDMDVDKAAAVAPAPTKESVNKLFEDTDSDDDEEGADEGTAAPMAKKRKVIEEE